MAYVLTLYVSSSAAFRLSRSRGRTELQGGAGRRGLSASTPDLLCAGPAPGPQASEPQSPLSIPSRTIRSPDSISSSRSTPLGAVATGVDRV
jgi:hypothetical protein